MAKREKRDSSDPLPFIQVDRAAKQPAAMLAGQLGVTFQHALGGLIQFWEINGNRRELEKLIDQNLHEVVLDGAEVQRRFTLAMGKRCELADLVDLHLLEPRDGGRYRVRGMSRFFKPLVELRGVKARAVAGGQASVKARKAKNGTAQPHSGPRSAAGSEPGSTAVRQPVREPFGGGSNTRSNGSRTTPEAQSNTDDRRQTSDDKNQSPTTTDRAAPVVVDEAWRLWAQEVRKNTRHFEPEFTAPEGWERFWESFGKRSEKARCLAWKRYLRDEHFRDRGWPMAVFITPGVHGVRLELDAPEEAAA